MLDVSADGTGPIFPKLDTLVVHIRTKMFEYEHWHTECWEALTEVLINRKRAGFPVRELRITGGWISETARHSKEKRRILVVVC